MIGTALKSVGAVLAGLIAGMSVVVVLTMAATALLFDGDWSAPPTGPYLAVNLLYSFAAAMLAGWVAGKLAGSRPVAHAAGVAILMVVLSLGGSGDDPQPGVPTWYGPSLLILMPLGALAGGGIRARSLEG